MFIINRREKARYKTLLAIVSNPHSEDPESLWQVFEDEAMQQTSYLTDPGATIDKMGFERLKIAMADNERIIIN